MTHSHPRRARPGHRISGRAAWLALGIVALSLFVLGEAFAQTVPPKMDSCAVGGKKTKGITVQLQADKGGEDTPSHVCLVSYQTVKGAVALDGRVEKPDPDGASTLFRIGSPGWNKVPQNDQDLEKSWPVLAPTNAESTCASRAEVEDICQPQFRLQSRAESLSPEKAVDLKHFVQCVKNDKPNGTEVSVAVLLVDAHTGGRDVTKQPLLCGLRLDRTTLTFNIEEMEGTAARVVGSIIGGSYAESPARVIDQGKIELPLVPRCQQHDVVLPATAGTSNAATVRLFLEKGQSGPQEVDPAAECKAPVGPHGQFKMALPNLRSTARRTIEVEVGDPKELPYARYARYEGSWFDFKPPAAVALRQAAISFRWLRDCLYPPDLPCPEASLSDAGVDRCRGCPVPDRPGKECAYVCDPQLATLDCPARGAGEVLFDSTRKESMDPGPEVLFDLPTSVRFRRPGRDDQWVVNLVYGNQLLSGFVSPEERYVDVDLRDWGSAGALDRLLNRRSAHLTEIVVRGPNGDLHHLDLVDRTKKDGPQLLRVDLPGVRCGVAVSYQLIGDRQHREMAVPIKDGRLTLKHPNESEDRWTGTITAGGAFVVSTLTRELNTLPVPVEPALSIGGILGYRHAGWPVIIDGRYTFMLGAQSYFRVRGPLERSAEVRRVLYHRHLLELAGTVVLWPRFRLGGSVGVLLGTPLIDTDRPRVGDFNVAFTTGFHVQIQLLERWGFEGGPRIIVQEPVYTFQTDFSGFPSWSTAGDTRFALEMRLRYTL